jgi:hypothetical protein
VDLSTIRTEVRDIVGEETADFWSDAELNRYINEACYRFAGENRWSWLLTEGTGQLQANDPELLLTQGVADYRHLNIMLTRSGDTRPYLPKKVSPARGFRLRQAHYTAQSYPAYFYVTTAEDSSGTGDFTTVVRFLPTPNGAMDVEFQYYRQVAELDADSDVPDIPVQYHKALVHYAAGTAWLKELNGGAKAQEQFNLYDTIVMQARDDEESAADDEVLVWGGASETEGNRDALDASDYALRRIAQTLGP